jgi:hypothetical protein
MKTMNIETIVMDRSAVPLPEKNKKIKKPRVSRFKLFFDKLSIGQSFTCACDARHGIRVCFIGYRKKYNPKFNLIGRTTKDKKTFRFWVVPNDAS